MLFCPLFKIILLNYEEILILCKDCKVGPLYCTLQSSRLIKKGLCECGGGEVGEISEKDLVYSSFSLVVFSIKNSQLLIWLVCTVYGNSPHTKRKNVGREGHQL